jgi:preprotein translocase subunit SecA
VWAEVAALLPRINAFIAGRAEPLSLEPPAPGADAKPAPLAPARDAVAAAGSRNQPCPCGSGRRFKACHGSLRA